MKNSLLRKPFVYQYFNASLWIIGLNVLIFFFTSVSPRMTVYFSMNPYLVLRANAYWQFLTYMFTHANFSHILFNMLGLFFFGSSVERRMGSKEFLLFYFVSGLGAGLFSFLVFLLTGSYNVILLGASGAVYSVLLAFAVYFPYANIYLFGLFPIRAPLLVLGYAVIEVFSQVFSLRSGISHLTHLAGFGIAFLYFIIRLGINPIKIFKGGSGNHWQ